MTGPMSDRDIQFLEAQVPGLATSEPGNYLLIDVLRRFENRKIELADLIDDYFAEHGSLRGWRRHRSQWLKENPLSFGDLYDNFRDLDSSPPTVPQ